MNFQVQPTHFQNIKRMEKSIEKVFRLTIIIANAIHIIYRIRTGTLSIFTIHFFYLIGPYFISYFIFQPIELGLAYLFLPIPFIFMLFMYELRIFSYLGFTYTTYITVKSEFLII